MISLNGEKVALLAAAVALVSNNTNHRYPTTDENLERIAFQIGADDYSVYDLGPRNNKNRFVRFDFSNGSQIEILVGSQPELLRNEQPEGDDTPPGTPIALAA